jgi:hypothetical protein
MAGDRGNQRPCPNGKNAPEKAGDHHVRRIHCGKGVVPHTEEIAEKDPQSGDHHVRCPFRSSATKVSARKDNCGDQRPSPENFFENDSGDQCETGNVGCPP